MPFNAIPGPLSAAITARGYAEPTPVQAQVLEPDAIGRDLIVSAQTGSGKTVAFGLAMGAQILGDSDRAPPPGLPMALIIAPTRELALQVSRELMWLYQTTGARVSTCVGGMDASTERRSLSHGTHIVVGTPGRLRDHLERGALDLSALKVAVLDEADEMLDMGFREDLEQILDASPEGRRTMMFSATMPKPIVALAKRYQKDALRISTVGEDRGHGDIEYKAVTVAPSEIENAVVNLLRYYEPDTAMLFCATRDNVRHLHASLMDRGFSAVALSGEHSQNERNAALQSLRDGRAKVCFATDVAARGIDLPTLSLVVHVELPRDAETLQHRSGRTGRAGRKGTAVLIVPYPRRRRVEMVLRGAKINAEWVPVPTTDMIREADRERLLVQLSAPADIDDEDRVLGAKVLAERGAEEVAAMLVSMFRARMPVAEEMLEQSSEAPRAPDGPRPGFEETAWVRMNSGRKQNADPRWILPLLCRRGHITKAEIGAIRITADETMFEVPRHVATRFAASVKRTAADDDGEGGVLIVAADSGPHDAKRPERSEQPRAPRPTLSSAPGGGDRPNRPHRPQGDRPGHGRPPARHHAKPYQGKGPRTPR
ncbi:DEAD/DEAH box helicase [soil metagenome]